MSGTLDLKDSIGITGTNSVVLSATNVIALGSTDISSPSAGNYTVNPATGSIVDDYWSGSITPSGTLDPQPGDPTSFTLTLADASQNILEFTESLDGGGSTPAIGVKVIAVTNAGIVAEQINDYFVGAPSSYVAANLNPNQFFVFSKDDLTLAQPGYPGPTATELTFGQTLAPLVGSFDLTDSIGLTANNTVTIAAANVVAADAAQVTSPSAGSYRVDPTTGSIEDDDWSGTFGSPQPGDPTQFFLTVADTTQNIITFTESLEGQAGLTPAIGVKILGVNGTGGIIGEQINDYFAGAPSSYVNENLNPNQFFVFSRTELSITDPNFTGLTQAELTFGPTICFAEGTRISTDRGEVAVEDLVEGDQVAVLHDGAATTRPVVWIGHRTVNLKAHRDPFLAQPIRIRRGAFGEAMPSRDLLVSPDHALFFDGVLVPARLLVNGASIVRETQLAKVRYFHVELDQHSIIRAENLPTESYLDTGNRGFFQNGGQVVDMNPDLSTISGQEMRDTQSCAPFVHAADDVRVIWECLAGRAEQLGFAPMPAETTQDPSLRVAVNGRECHPVCVTGDVYSFLLPSGPSEVRLQSRAARPCAAQPWIDDQRLLGVVVNRLRVRHGSDVVDMALDGPGFASGWCDVEQSDRQMWRWTNGDAVLQLPAAHGATRLLDITIGSGMSYPLEAAPEVQVLAAIA